MAKFPRIDHLLPGLFQPESPNALLDAERAGRILRQVIARKNPEDLDALVEHLSRFSLEGRSIISWYLSPYSVSAVQLNTPLKANELHARTFRASPEKPNAMHIRRPLQEIMGDANARGPAEAPVLEALLKGAVPADRFAELWMCVQGGRGQKSASVSDSIESIAIRLRAKGFSPETSLWQAIVDAWTSAQHAYQQLAQTSDPADILRVKRLLHAALFRHRAMGSAQKMPPMPADRLLFGEAVAIGRFALKAGIPTSTIVETLAEHLVRSDRFALFDGIMPREAFVTPRGLPVRKAIASYLGARLLEQDALDASGWRSHKTHQKLVAELDQSFKKRIETTLSSHRGDRLKAMEAAMESTRLFTAIESRLFGNVIVTNLAAARKAKEAADHLCRVSPDDDDSHDALLAARLSLYDLALGLCPDASDETLDDRGRVLVRHFQAAVTMQIKILGSQGPAMPPVGNTNSSGSEPQPPPSQGPASSPHPAPAASAPPVGAAGIASAAALPGTQVFSASHLSRPAWRPLAPSLSAQLLSSAWFLKAR